MKSSSFNKVFAKYLNFSNCNADNLLLKQSMQ